MGPALDQSSIPRDRCRDTLAAGEVQWFTSSVDVRDSDDHDDSPARRVVVQDAGLPEGLRDGLSDSFGSVLDAVPRMSRVTR